ncbi:flavin-dependent monooxygenase QhpG [Paraburkholderia unamae]|uniref:Flavin-dependent dehydrogenase n=1 Tax=Paraburkholderia unamae TaxID=219649 RepID=A0ABX5KRV1_9BURK|nr:tryptophan 7-halogenase [Paraburkholderia unamae]PVX82895.1 flavin-dependent dehydrogenase [Paraburkholderia unamae]CAG9268996.1 Dehydrogenase (Flavoprotein) [Paraburkholderia unamae]
MNAASIVVLGAGPAGAAVARALTGLGHRVQVVSDWRRFDAAEALSVRAIEALRRASLHHAASCGEGPCVRTTLWNGALRTLDAEFLVDRRLFDTALREDLYNAGVDVIEANVRSLQSSAAGHDLMIETADGPLTLRADFLVEARGRFAPLLRDATRGPQTLSLLNVWRGRPGTAATAVESLPAGWAWMARLRDGRCYWQLTLDVANPELPQRDELLAYCERMRHSPLASDFFAGDAANDARLYARSSTATLCGRTGGHNWLRVGDAAMAVDPLAGNGVFQSLTSALQAPAVIHTLLERPERAPLALRFHQQRIEQLFMRFARTGRDVYALEQRWTTQPFWLTRGVWPDDRPAHVSADFNELNVERAPVIEGGLIAEADVVASPDQPLGIWHLCDAALAPVVEALRREPAEQVLKSLDADQARLLRHWLAMQDFPERYV